MPRYTDKKAAAVIRKIFANSARVTRYNAAGERINQPINGWDSPIGYIQTDGYRAIALAKVPAEGVPALYGIHIAGPEDQARTANMHKTVEKLLKNVYDLTNEDSELLKFTEADVKSGTFSHGKSSLCFRAGRYADSPVYNSAYLRDMLTALPDADFYIDRSKKSLSPIWACSEYGVGVILPIRL